MAQTVLHGYISAVTVTHLEGPDVSAGIGGRLPDAARYHQLISKSTTVLNPPKFDGGQPYPQVLTSDLIMLRIGMHLVRIELVIWHQVNGEYRPSL